MSAVSRSLRAMADRSRISSASDYDLPRYPHYEATMRRRAGLLAILLTAAVGCSSTPPTTPTPTPTPVPTGPCGTASGPAVVHHVIWIWMENRDYAEVIGSGAAPYENQLAAQCGLA